MKPLSERDENPGFRFQPESNESPGVGMKPLSERDENNNSGLRTNPETVKM